MNTYLIISFLLITLHSSITYCLKLNSNDFCSLKHNKDLKCSGIFNLKCDEYSLCCFNKTKCPNRW